MAAVLTFIGFALSALLGALLAISVVRLVVVQLARGAAGAALVGARVGELAMLVPSVWFALFLGAPLGGGFAISAAGESAAQVGIALGYALSLFGGICLGGLAGAVLGVVARWVRPHGNAT